MLRQLSEVYWAMAESGWPAVSAILAKLIEVGAGPVDDLQREGLPISRVGNTAVIPINGVMVRSAPLWAQRYGLASASHIVESLQSAAVDDDIENIVFAIDSPGGSVAAMINIGDAAKALAQSKTLIAQVSGTAASAALYVATRADKIFANRLDMVGSIGVRMALIDASEAYKTAGLKKVVIDTGEHKSAGEFGTKITDAQIAEFQRVVDGYFNEYIAALVDGRGMTETQARKLGDGRMFFASEAIKNGLIDGIQSMTETLGQYVSEKPNTSKRMSAHNRAKLMQITS